MEIRALALGVKAVYSILTRTSLGPRFDGLGVVKSEVRLSTSASWPRPL